jgi:hypothetical protein
MYDECEKSNLSIDPALEVYLPTEECTVEIRNLRDAIDCVERILHYEADNCWIEILNGLYAARTPETAQAMRRELRREFLLRGMTLPEDANAARPFRQRAQMWLSSIIEGSCQIEIELTKPTGA